MTINYIEIIRNHPYYHQVDALLLEEAFPRDTEENIWETWRERLPPYCGREKVFLEMVQWGGGGMSFAQSIRDLAPKLNKEWICFVENNMNRIEEILEHNKYYFVIPSTECWQIIRRDLLTCNNTRETIIHFFLRVASQHYRDNWEATTRCFQDLLAGKILIGGQENKCFVRGTMVWTTQGCLPIEQIQEGDRVATHNGRFSTVLKTFQNPIDGRVLYHIYSKHGKVATATHDHPFLVYNQQYNQIVWKQAGDLNQYDYLMKATLLHNPTTDYSYFNHYPILNRFINQHPEVAGMVLSKAHHNLPITQGMAQSMEDEKTIMTLLSYRNIRIKLWEWVLETRQYPFVRGWMENFQSRTYFQSNEEASLVAMALNLYHYDMVVCRSFCRWYIQRNKNNMDHMLTIGEKTFVRFSHRKKCIRQHEHLYTLHVNDDHSYTVNGYIVKNCMGLTPDTMIVKEDGPVPISQLKLNDVLIDKDQNKVVVKKINKTHYKGTMVSIHNCAHTAYTPICTMENEVHNARDITDTSTIMPPPLSFYHDPGVDKETTNNHINFLLRYLFNWEVENINGWLRWHLSFSDRLFINPVLQYFHPFQYKIEDHTIYIQKNILENLVDKWLHKMQHVSIEKLKYFFSYMNKQTKTNRLTHEQAFLCDNIRSLLERGTHLKKYNYMGEVYDIEIGGGNNFCTTQTIICKQIKMDVGGELSGDVSHLYVPDHFFQKINLIDGLWDGVRQASDIWDEVVQSQIKHGKPSIICVDRNKGECVSGDTRILTYNGVVRISTKKDEMVSVWNGSHFIDVVITCTGDKKRFLKIHFSNGMCLTCTPYHKFFLKGQKKINASEIKCGDELAPFQLPSISTMDMLPSSIVMTLEWIAKRCVYMENVVVLFDRDMESLRDILLDLQYCGLKSEIVFNSFRNEYELRIDKRRWNLLNHRHLNKNTTYIEGDRIEGTTVVKIEDTPTYQESFCFHEPFSGTAIFEGVATGQCENPPDTPYVQGCIYLSKFLTPNPWKKTMRKYHITVYTMNDCPFFHLLQLENINMERKNIHDYPEEWKLKRHIHALTSLPAIFMNNTYIGDFVDFWNHYLCPVFDFDGLHRSVYWLCRGLDNPCGANRPIFLEIYGFWEMLVRMRLSIDEPKSKQLHSLVFDTIYHAALTASNDLAMEKGPCVNSNKIISSLDLETMHEKWHSLRHNILLKGLRNKIYLKTCDPEEKNILCHFYDLLRCDLGNDKDILDHVYSRNSVQELTLPSHLKKTYRNEYELPQMERLSMMINRKKYQVMNDTFHLYIQEKMNKDVLSEIEQTAWSEGFHAIEIHKQ